MKLRPFRAAVTLTTALTTAAAPLLAGAQTSYEFKKYVPTLAATGSGSGQAPGAGGTSPAPQPALQLSTATINFGDVATHTTETRQVLVSNPGTGPLTFTAAPAVTGATQFAAGLTTCGASLAAGADCLAEATFSPTSTGALSGTLSFVSNADGSPHTVSLTGFGYEYARFTADLLESPNATLQQSLAAANTSLNAQGTVWTVGARPAGRSGQGVSIRTDSAYASGQLYVEVQASTRSAWVYLSGGTDSLSYGIALDGPGCSVAGVYVAQCTSNSSGNWSNSRLGLLLDHTAGTVTITRNGVRVYSKPVANAFQAFRLKVMDRDVPTNSQTRTYTMYPTPSTWQYAPSNVAPFARQ